MTPESLTDYLHRNIPLTAAMAARVQHLADDRVEIAAPLAPNHNHAGTAFGGSLSTLAIVSGWALLLHALRAAQIPHRLVIQSSSCDYLRPVTADFRAESRLPAEDRERFLQTLLRRGRARISVKSILTAGGETVAEATGNYVAIQEQTA